MRRGLPKEHRRGPRVVAGLLAAVSLVCLLLVGLAGPAPTTISNILITVDTMQVANNLSAGNVSASGWLESSDLSVTRNASFGNVSVYAWLESLDLVVTRNGSFANVSASEWLRSLDLVVSRNASFANVSVSVLLASLNISVTDLVTMNRGTISSFLEFIEQVADPPAPGAGSRRIYANASGFFEIDSAGVISGFGGGGVGAADTDRTATYVVGFTTDCDYVCDGLNDHVEINQAIADMVTNFGTGRIILREGRVPYDIDQPIGLVSGMTLEGQGWSTVLNYTGVYPGCITLNTLNNVKVRDLKIDIMPGAGGVNTRPNCIIAQFCSNIEISGVWAVGDKTVADDGAVLRQNGIVLDWCTYSKVVNCKSELHVRYGVLLEDQSCYNIVMGSTCSSNKDGIHTRPLSNYNILSANTCDGNSENSGIYVYQASINVLSDNVCKGNRYGIFLESGTKNLLTGNICAANTRQGIYLLTSVENTVSGNTIETSSWNGIFLSTSARNVVTGNTVRGSAWNGIRLFTVSDNNVLSGNIFYGNTQIGILVDSSDFNVITGNACNENDYANTGSFDGIQIGAGSDDNLVEGNECNYNDRYGINVAGGSRNRVKDNQLIGNTLAPFADAGTATELATFTSPFVDGTDPQVSGFLINLADEYAVSYLWVPLEVQQVVRIKVYARAAAASGTTMVATFMICGAADNEPYQTHNGSVGSRPTGSTNFAADDVIYWTVNTAGVLALLGGDSVEVLVLYAVADGGVATEAYIRTVTVEYV